MCFHLPQRLIEIGEHADIAAGNGNPSRTIALSCQDRDAALPNHGDFGRKKSPAGGARLLYLVAGAGFEPATFRL